MFIIIGVVVVVAVVVVAVVVVAADAFANSSVVQYCIYMM